MSVRTFDNVLKIIKIIEDLDNPKKVLKVLTGGDVRVILAHVPHDVVDLIKQLENLVFRVCQFIEYNLESSHPSELLPSLDLHHQILKFGK